jgi:hypothetical protein
MGAGGRSRLEELRDEALELCDQAQRMGSQAQGVCDRAAGLARKVMEVCEEELADQPVPLPVPRGGRHRHLSVVRGFGLAAALLAGRRYAQALITHKAVAGGAAVMAAMVTGAVALHVITAVPAVQYGAGARHARNHVLRHVAQAIPILPADGGQRRVSRGGHGHGKLTTGGTHPAPVRSRQPLQPAPPPASSPPPSPKPSKTPPVQVTITPSPSPSQPPGGGVCLLGLVCLHL